MCDNYARVVILLPIFCRLALHLARVYQSNYLLFLLYLVAIYKARTHSKLSLVFGPFRWTSSANAYIFVNLSCCVGCNSQHFRRLAGHKLAPQSRSEWPPGRLGCCHFKLIIPELTLSSDLVCGFNESLAPQVISACGVVASSLVKS